MKRYSALTVVVFALISLAGVVKIAFAGPEPLASKEIAPAPAPPPCDWTGFYLGLNGGYGGGNITWLEGNVSLDQGQDELAIHETPNGFIGGGQIGYNYQLRSGLVIGIEGDGAYNTADEHRTLVETNDDTKHYGSQNDFVGSVALRVGFALLDNRALIYAKAGVSFSHWNYDYVNDETNAEERPEFDRWSEDDLLVNGMWGAGLEYMINCHWSAKMEYQHYFHDQQHITGTLVEDFEADDPHGYFIDAQHDSVRFGLNYRF